MKIFIRGLASCKTRHTHRPFICFLIEAGGHKLKVYDHGNSTKHETCDAHFFAHFVEVLFVRVSTVFIISRGNIIFTSRISDKSFSPILVIQNQSCS